MTPDGSEASTCTKLAPCTFDRAFDVVDATRPNVKLATGDHNIVRAFNRDISANFYGPARVTGSLSDYGASFSAYASFTFRDLEFAEGLGVGRSTGAGPQWTHDLRRVTVHGQLLFNLSDVRVRESRVTAPAHVVAVSISSGNLTLERVEIVGGVIGLRVSTGRATVTNSVIREQVGNLGTRTAIELVETSTASAFASSVSFTTFYNTFWKCPDGDVLFTSRNNIFLNELADAPVDTVTGTRCNHQYAIIKPQTNAPAGSANILNIDPLFVNKAAGDFHLMPGSPAIDAADPTATEMVDFENTPRPQGTRHDIGAFEHRP